MEGGGELKIENGKLKTERRAVARIVENHGNFILKILGFLWCR